MNGLLHTCIQFTVTLCILLSKTNANTLYSIFLQGAQYLTAHKTRIASGTYIYCTKSNTVHSMHYVSKANTSDICMQAFDDFVISNMTDWLRDQDGAETRTRAATEWVFLHFENRAKLSVCCCYVTTQTSRHFTNSIKLWCPLNYVNVVLYLKHHGYDKTKYVYIGISCHCYYLPWKSTESIPFKPFNLDLTVHN